MKIRLFFPAIAVLFILSTTGYSHETAIAPEHEFETDSELREAVVTNPLVHATELTRVPAATAASVKDYLKDYVKRVSAVRYFDEEMEIAGGNCGRCWPCHLGCSYWDGHVNNCNGAVCACIGSPPYSGCY